MQGIPQAHFDQTDGTVQFEFVKDETPMPPFESDNVAEMMAYKTEAMKPEFDERLCATAEQIEKLDKIAEHRLQRIKEVDEKANARLKRVDLGAWKRNMLMADEKEVLTLHTIGRLFWGVPAG